MEHPELELQLIIAGSALLDRYGTTIDFIEEDGFKVNEKVYMVLEGENPTAMAKTTGLGIMELSTAFYNLDPDVVVSIADRFETMSTAIAASYMNIPLAHIQGGEITGNIDEKVRHAVTKLADIHLVASDKARNRLIRMGEDPDYVYNTGCPSIDIAADVIKNSKMDFDPIKKYGGVGPEISWQNGYLVVMQHPVTTEYKMARKQIEETLYAIHDIGLPTFWFWPNVDAGSDGTSTGIRAFREKNNPANIRFFKNMEPEDFLKLIYNAKCMIGNSSAGIRECSYLGVPVVNIGTRQFGRDRGNNVIDVSDDEILITSAIQKQLNNGFYPSDYLYGKGGAGKSIAEVLSSSNLKITKHLTYN